MISSTVFSAVFSCRAENMKALVVPKEAVREVGQLSLVNVLDHDGYPQRRFVTLGKNHGDHG